MANNRIEATSAVDAQMIPEIEASELRSLLNTELIDSLVFRKDVIASETPAAGSVTVDFSDKDTATISTTVNLAISFSGIENGDIKTIALTKVATNTVSFVGATDVSPRKLYINTTITYVEYEVRSKNGIITINSKNIDNDITDEVTAEIDAAILASDGGVRTKYYELGDWNMDVSQSLSFDVESTLGLDHEKIIGYRVIIRGDIGSVHEEYTFDLGIYQNAINGYVSMNRSGPVGGGPWTLSPTRLTGGFFDSTNFNDTSFNRGWLIVEYFD